MAARRKRKTARRTTRKTARRTKKAHAGLGNSQKIGSEAIF